MLAHLKMAMTCNTGGGEGKGRSCRREVEGGVGVGQMNNQRLIIIVVIIIIVIIIIVIIIVVIITFADNFSLHPG